MGNFPSVLTVGTAPQKSIGTHHHDRRLVRPWSLTSVRCGSDESAADIDFQRRRGLERSVVLDLAEGRRFTEYHAEVIVGPTGIDKTSLAFTLFNIAIHTPIPGSSTT